MGVLKKIAIKSICIIIFIFAALWSVHAVYGETISLYVKGGDTRAVLQGIAKNGHIDLIGSEHVNGSIDVALSDVTPIEAIKHIVAVKGYHILEEKNRIVILGEGAEKSYESYILSPKVMRPMALEKALRALVPSERLTIASETNQVILYGSLREYKSALAILEALDKVPPQVALEVQVISMTDAFKREHGVEWTLALGPRGSEKGERNSLKISTLAGTANYLFMTPSLKLSHHEGGATVLAHPTIMTINGEEAKILIGDRIPVVVESKSQDEKTTSVRYEEAGIKLTYTPYVGEDGYIDATLVAEVSTPQLVPEIKAYRITTRQASTRVRVKEGQMIAIGGLIDQRTDSVKGKIPFLGDIPLLGKLFSYSYKGKENSEIVILIRATIKR